MRYLVLFQEVEKLAASMTHLWSKDVMMEHNQAGSAYSFRV